MSCHFPEHAFIYSSRVVLLNEGKILHSGLPGESITSERLKTLYGVDVDIVTVKNRMNQNLQVCIPSWGLVESDENLVESEKEYALA